MRENQEELEIDGLQKSLDELLQVADATELNKSYGGTSVEYSGHYDERGKRGGGGADKGDVGGIDNMMIAKMSEAGVPAGLIADFAAFMAGGEEEEEEEEDFGGKMMEYGEYSEANRPAAEPFAKSIDELREASEVADAIDVSPFLEALTMRVADQIDGIRKSLDESHHDRKYTEAHVAAAMHQMGSLMKSQSAVINELGHRLGLIENAPARPRGATSLEGAKALHKAVRGEVGPSGANLSKSEVLSTLSYMNLEKSIKQINGQATYELVCMYDGGAPMDDTVVEAARSFLRDNPSEANLARSYA